MVTPLLWVMLFQTDSTRPLQTRTMIESAKSRAYLAQQEQASAARKRDFEKRFNKLIDALQEFTRAYNAAQGQVWPAKEAEALRVALQNLERAMPPNKPVPSSEDLAGPAPDRVPNP